MVPPEIWKFKTVDFHSYFVNSQSYSTLPQPHQDQATKVFIVSFWHILNHVGCLCIYCEARGAASGAFSGFEPGLKEPSRPPGKTLLCIIWIGMCYHHLNNFHSTDESFVLVQLRPKWGPADGGIRPICLNCLNCLYQPPAVREIRHIKNLKQSLLLGIVCFRQRWEVSNRSNHSN